MHRIGNIILFREENLGLIVGLELMMMTKLNRRKKMLWLPLDLGFHIILFNT